MKEILQLYPNERATYFEQAAARSDIIKSVNIIEKDFWVCWALEKIFSNTELAPHITFKGGTSLSKCYNLIERFSEDIDLTLSKQYIGITTENDPAAVTGTNQRKKRLEQLTEKVKNKITNDVKPLLIEEFRKDLSMHLKDEEWKLETDKTDEQTLIFYYPTCFPRISEGYIQSSIKLEFGARGDINPCETKAVSPYIQQILPEVFNSPAEIKVTSLLAKRTFWEKTTLLHAEYHRDPSKPLPDRLFRHYYDIVMLDKSNLTKEALQDTALLSDVVQNKAIYFPSKWANLNKATIGSLRLYPNDIFIERLREDHKNMAMMFFGNTPDFDVTLAEIKRIEGIINGE